MVLAGSINEGGGKGVGLCGKDGNMVKAREVGRAVVDPDSPID